MWNACGLSVKYVVIININVLYMRSICVPHTIHNIAHTLHYTISSLLFSGVHKILHKTY